VSEFKCPRCGAVLEVCLVSGGPSGLDAVRQIEVEGIEAATLRDFFRAVAAGGTLAVGSWVGAGKTFSRPQYDSLMDKLERAGLVVNQGGNVGRVLTAAGRGVFKKLA
jgi:hypothetical protein